MIDGHACHEAILLGNGKVLITGGYDNRGGVTNAELYDPANGTFAATGRYVKETFDLNSCQPAASSMLPDGRVLFVWQDGGGEVYDPDSGLFTKTGNPIVGGQNNGLPAATLLMNGKVLVAGGASDAGFDTRAGLYSASSGTFAVTGNMTIGRTLHTATLLPDGNVMLTGTMRFGGGALTSAELYDPIVGAFRATGDLTTPRALHTATLLNDGKVLITGGSTFGRPTARAEFYTPSVLVSSPQLFGYPEDGQGFIWNATTGVTAWRNTPAVAGDILSTYTTTLAEGGLIPPQISVGGRLAEILYFGAAPGYPRYNQVNFRVPNGVAPGDAVPVRLTYISRPSNEVTIGVR